MTNGARGARAVPPRSLRAGPPGKPRMTVAALLALALLAPLAAAADEPTPPASAPVVLETIVVSGDQPGPGLWKVTRDGRVLWLLGTQSPLPRRMRWETREVERRISQSQAVLLPPSANVKVDGGMIAGMFLLPSLLGARNNPDDATLAEVVPPALYARWQPLKRKYLGDSRAVEKRRPLFAAGRLFEKAVQRSGLTFDTKLEKTVRRLAKRNDVPIEQPKLDLKLEKPREAIRQFRASRLDDLACFEQTLDRLETDLEAMRVRANAWATGDVATLRERRVRVDQVGTCIDAFLQSTVAQQRGFDKLEQRMRDAWLTAAEAALAKHASTFAMLSMREILSEDGYLAELKRRGYAVEEP